MAKWSHNLEIGDLVRHVGQDDSGVIIDHEAFTYTYRVRWTDGTETKMHALDLVYLKAATEDAKTEAVWNLQHPAI